MKKLMIVGASEYMTSFVGKAAQQCSVIVVSPDVPDEIVEIADKVYRVDVADREQILEIAQENNIDGVVTEQAELPVQSVAYVAEKMGLVGNGFETARLFTNKAKMRKKLEEAGINVVLPYKVVQDLEEAKQAFSAIDAPCVVKPVDSRGSRGVYFVKDKKELLDVFDKAKNESRTSRVIVERYVKGKEIVVEGLALNGQCKTIAVGESLPFAFEDIFSPRERVFPSSLSKEMEKRVAHLNTSILENFGLKNGVSQSEYLVDGEDIYFIESCARGGGMFISSDIAPHVSGIDLADFAIRTALGEEGDIPELKPSSDVCGYIAFYLPEGKVESVSGIEEVKNFDWVINYKLDPLEPGTIAPKIQDKVARYCIALVASTEQEYEKRKEVIRKTIKVVMSSGRDLIWL